MFLKQFLCHFVSEKSLSEEFLTLNLCQGRGVWRVWLHQQRIKTFTIESRARNSGRTLVFLPQRKPFFGVPFVLCLSRGFACHC